VLVVDDERTLARAIKAFLSESGYEAEVAGDAEQALRLLDTLRPDVVFCDVRLPGMDGIELLRRIRREATMNGPLRELTATVHPEVASFLADAEPAALRELERELSLSIVLRASSHLARDQFEVVGVAADVETG